MLGLAGLFWVPFGNAFGRRPVWIISTLGTLASVLWFPFATSYGELLAARLLYGLFGSPIECFAPIAIADIFFTSERSVMHAWFL